MKDFEQVTLEERRLMRLVAERKKNCHNFPNTEQTLTLLCSVHPPCSFTNTQIDYNPQNKTINTAKAVQERWN